MRGSLGEWLKGKKRFEVDKVGGRFYWGEVEEESW